jgi:hypothetical protein
VRYFVAMLVAAATLATAVVSVRLHLHVAQLRYRLWSLEEESRRAERELRLAHAELEAAKAPRRLMDRWRALHDAPVAVTSATPTPAPETRIAIEAPPADEVPAAVDETPAVDDPPLEPAASEGGL